MDLAVLSHIGFKLGTEDFYPGDVTVESSFLLFMIFAWKLFYIQMLKIFAMQIFQSFGFYLLKQMTECYENSLAF